MERLKSIVTFFIDTGTKWSADKATRLAAALAYYTLFSLAPLVIILTTIFGQFFDDLFATSDWVETVTKIVGPEAAEFIVGLAEGASAPSSVTIATLISLGVMFWGASNIFNHLHETLNIIWGVKRAPGTVGIIATIKGRMIAFGIVFIAGFVLVIFLLLNTVVASAIELLSEIVPEVLDILPTWRTIQIAQFLIGFIAITLLFALFYKILPDVEINWRDVWVGAAFTSMLIMIGTFALSIYFRFSSVGSLYGAAGSLMVILLWFYYSAQIFLFGAEFTQVYATRYGSKIVPDDHAIAVEFVVATDKGEEGADGPEDGADKTDGPLVDDPIEGDGQPAAT